MECKSRRYCRLCGCLSVCFSWSRENATDLERMPIYITVYWEAILCDNLKVCLQTRSLQQNDRNMLALGVVLQHSHPMECNERVAPPGHGLRPLRQMWREATLRWGHRGHLPSAARHPATTGPSRRSLMTICNPLICWVVHTEGPDVYESDRSEWHVHRHSPPRAAGGDLVQKPNPVIVC